MERHQQHSVTRLDITVDPETKEGALEVLAVAKPQWSADLIQSIDFKDGITNRIMGFHLKDCQTDMVVIRCYGDLTEKFIDREIEVKNMEKLHKAGCAGELYSVFNNGLCYEFVNGVTTTTETVRDTVISRKIAEEMAKVHSIVPDPEEDVSMGLFKKITHFINLFPEKFQNVDKQFRFENSYPSISKLKDELHMLEKHLSTLNMPVVFCHNDILLANIIYNPETGGLKFIDFEYGMYNYQAFDIGNHLNEFAGLESVDYSLYPEKEFQLKWLQNYLKKYFIFNNIDRSVTENDVKILYVQANKCALASHLFWSCWGIVQERYSSIGYDFLGYAITRYNEYTRRKEEFLEMNIPIYI